MTTKEKLIQDLEDQIGDLKMRIEKVRSVDLGELELDAQQFGNFIDFNNLPHDKVIEVIKNIGGKWSKTPADSATVHYETEKNGLKIRCYRGEPPPNCKVVDVIETIPAQPERIVTTKKLVCQ